MAALLGSPGSWIGLDWIGLDGLDWMDGRCSPGSWNGLDGLEIGWMKCAHLDHDEFDAHTGWESLKQLIVITWFILYPVL